MPAETIPPPDDALAALMASPGFQERMAALTQQAMAQVQALVAALRAVEQQLPLPQPPPPPPPVDDTLTFPFGDPQVVYPVFLGGPALMPIGSPAPGVAPPVLTAAVDGADPGALTRPVVQQLKGLVDTLRQFENQPPLMPKPVRETPSAPEVMTAVEEVTALLGSSSNRDMLALLPAPQGLQAPAPTQTGTGDTADAAASLWTMIDHARADAEGGVW